MLTYIIHILQKLIIQLLEKDPNLRLSARQLFIDLKVLVKKETSLQKNCEIVLETWKRDASNDEKKMFPHSREKVQKMEKRSLIRKFNSV